MPCPTFHMDLLSNCRIWVWRVSNKYYSAYSKQMSFKLLVFSIFILAAYPLHLTHHNVSSGQNSTKNATSPTAISPCLPPGRFNASTGNCDCLNGSVADPATATCLCPQQKPHFDGTQCIACNPPDYFEATSRKCQNCPSGASFNSTSKQCEKIQCTGGKQLDSKTNACNCPKEKQYEYGGVCN